MKAIIVDRINCIALLITYLNKAMMVETIKSIARVIEVLLRAQSNDT